MTIFKTKNKQYLQLMKETPKIFGITNEGVSKEKIIEFQQKNGINFPKAYQEFLYFAGAYCNLQITNTSLSYSLERNKYVTEFLKEEKLSIEGGEFWVISDLDGGEQFDFFYFNDPDAEDPENPPVYASYPGYLEEGGKLKEKIADSFSQYINDKIKAYTEEQDS